MQSGPRAASFGKRVGLVIVLTLFGCFFGLPLLWLILAAGKSGAALQLQAPLSGGTLDDLVQNWNLLFRFANGAFLHWLGNSAIYAGGALVLGLAITVPAGYALALTEFRLRKWLLVLTLVVMLMPSAALVLPIFLELSSVNLIGSPMSLILPFSFFPFGVYLTYIYFGTSVPRELLAAARMDGCSEVQVFLRIAVPLALPIIAIVAFFSFVQNWTNYFLPFVLLPNDDGYPIQIGLTLLGRGDLPLATVVSTLPVTILFLVFQRFLISGATTGALMGT